MRARAERKHPLLGARSLLVAAGAAERGVEAVAVERLLERLGLHDVGVNVEPCVNGSMPAAEPVLVDVDDGDRGRSPFAVSSRKAIISRNFQVVSTCSSGNGGLPG